MQTSGAPARKKHKPGEKQHWWPQAVSKYWADSDGKVHCITASGEKFSRVPREHAKISNAHDLVLGESSPWNQTFEYLFQEPDDEFPEVVDWLFRIVKMHQSGQVDRKGWHYDSPPDSPEMRQKLVQCLVSLVVRSPSFRTGIVRFVQSIRSGVVQGEHQNLVALNLQQDYTNLRDALVSAGKLAVYFSDSREFIFGDGFYYRKPMFSGSSVCARMFVPVTPNISVLYTSPMYSNPNPTIVTCRLHDGHVDLLNEIVQICSRQYLFFRTEEPVRSKHFLLQEHLDVAQPDVVDRFIASIPGVDFGATRPGIF